MSNSFLQEESHDLGGEKSKVKYLNVSRGALIEKVPEGTEGAKSRINRLGNQVFEKFYERMGGTIKYLWIKEGKYGKQIFVNFPYEEDSSINVCINLDSSYGRSFLNQIFNLDVTKPVILTPYSFKGDNGKTITGISIKQNGQKVEKGFPEGTPEVEFTQKGDKFYVNQMQQDERQEFLEDKLEKLSAENNITPPDSWFSDGEDDSEVSEEGMKELEEHKKKIKSEKGSKPGDDQDFDFDFD